MGRIVVPIEIMNIVDKKSRIECDILVDTGASALVLPKAWKRKLGEIETIGTVEMETADQRLVSGEVCGPVKIQIEGFRPIFNEVVFLDMEPKEGIFEPLLGSIILEQAQAAVDMVGHRLIHVKALDLK